MITKYTKAIQLQLRCFWQKYRNSKKRYQILLPVFILLLIGYILCLPSPIFDTPYSTVVSDRNGKMLGARIASDQQWRFPIVDSIPEKYKICLLEFEDKHFNYHWGIDPLALARAIKQNITQQRIVSGGSTLTMQTIRLSRKESRTIGEKVIEAILATRLEFSYSKDEILNLYASHAPMGGNVVGVEAASWRYFGHDVNNLSWAEAATLAVLPNSPSLLHFGRNRDKLIAKRNKLLQQLHSKGILDDISYELASTEPLAPQPFALPQIAPHLVTKIYLEQGGRAITSTIDKHRQEQIESVLNQWNAEFTQNGIRNIAALILDVQKNEVAAYCGNTHFESKESANQVDVIQARRSTGSILKPFLYNAMLEDGELLPDQLLADIPININGFSPKNFSLKYDGAAPASESLARSLNIPFVVSLRKYGLPKFYDKLKRMGLTTLDRSVDHYGLSIILGGAEGRLWDISHLYLQMAQSVSDYNRDAKYYRYKQASYILDTEADREHRTKTNSDPIFKAGSSWLTLDALTNVVRPEEIDWQSIPSIQKIAWKTGTSFGGRDGWSVGVTPRYVVGVWVGNTDGEGRPGLTGARTAGHVMFDIFNLLPKSEWFVKPMNDLTQTDICKESGLLRGLNCPESSIVSASINKKGLNGDACNYHKLVHLSEDIKYQVYNDCAGDRGIVHRPWFILPPRWEWYYRERHTDYQPLPPYSPECRDNTDTRLIEFIYPFANTSVSLPKQLDGSIGEMVFELAHRMPQNRVFWHLDDTFIGETKDFHKKSYFVPKGAHRLTVVDEGGHSTSIGFTVY